MNEWMDGFGEGGGLVDGTAPGTAIFEGCMCVVGRQTESVLFAVLLGTLPLVSDEDGMGSDEMG